MFVIITDFQPYFINKNGKKKKNHMQKHLKCNEMKIHTKYYVAIVNLRHLIIVVYKHTHETHEKHLPNTLEIFFYSKLKLIVFFVTKWFFYCNFLYHVTQRNQSAKI